MKQKLKEVLLVDIIPGVLVLTLFFTAIWVFDTYIAEWWWY